MSDDLRAVLLNAFMFVTLLLTILCSWQAWALRRIRRVQVIDREQLRDAWRVLDRAHLRHELKYPHGGWPHE